MFTRVGSVSPFVEDQAQTTQFYPKVGGWKLGQDAPLYCGIANGAAAAVILRQGYAR